MSRKLILIKHSIPEFGQGKLWYEWPLSEEGRRLCAPLAKKVISYHPAAVASSPERKAVETAEIVGSHLGMPVQVIDGLQENDRTEFKVVGQEKYERQFEEFFRRPDELIIGRETASQALSRFNRAVEGFVTDHPEGNLVVITHGTVITLFTAAHNDIEPWMFWKRLGLPSMAVFSLDDCGLLDTVTAFR